MKTDKKMLTRIGVIAAVVVIAYCMFKLRTCKDTYAELDYDAYYEEENSGGGEEEQYEEGEEEGEDYYEEDGGEEDVYNNYSLMESTMDDGQTNALFEAGM